MTLLHDFKMLGQSTDFMPGVQFTSFEEYYSLVLACKISCIMTYVALEDPPKFEKSIDLKLKMCSIKCALET